MKPTGVVGAKGDTGPMGPPGQVGFAGTRGVKGDIGVRGPMGDKGQCSIEILGTNYPRKFDTLFNIGIIVW